MSESLLKIFAYFGIMCAGGVVAVLFGSLFEKIKDKIRDIRIARRIKHRFDGKPIAKCWCRDCRWYDARTYACRLPGIGRHTPDNGFCYEADPVWKEIKK